MKEFIDKLLKRLDQVAGMAKSVLPQSRYHLVDSGLEEYLSDGSLKRYAWSEVRHVGILTTSDGPFAEDVFFIIKSDVGDLCITHAAATEMNLLDGFSHLPGFRWEQVASAMGCCTDASFPCWDRSWPVEAAVIEGD